jgi:flagellin
MAGANVNVSGNDVTVNSTFFKGTFSIADDATTADSPFSFTLLDSGLTFQLNTQPAASDNVTLGLPNVSSSNLGAAAYSLGSGSGALSVGGFLSSLISGGANDLTTDPQNAIRVVDAAIDDINQLRGFLGAFESNTVESNINSLGVALENLTASESQIRDLDFADEVAEFTRNQILFSAGTSVLASANTIPQSVLKLLA